MTTSSTFEHDRKVARKLIGLIFVTKSRVKFYLICMLFVITVADAVGMNETIETANNKTIEDKIKSWLRRARDKDGGWKRRFEISMLQHSLVDRDIEEAQHCPIIDERGSLRLTTNKDQLSIISNGSSFSFHPK
jgi:hypothetical protein